VRPLELYRDYTSEAPNPSLTLTAYFIQSMIITIHDSDHKLEFETQSF